MRWWNLVPQGASRGAAHLARRMGGEPILHLDVGGTTAKCSLVLGAEPQLSADYRIEWSRTSPGHPIQTPVVDIVEIGAGGGSIVRLGPGGTILVGPDSAGADPGPVCYGRGGVAPTITDAKLVTGVLDPSRFSEGLHLDKDAARDAFTPLAVRLGIEPDQVAEAAISVAESKMISALKLVSVQRGHDPARHGAARHGWGGTDACRSARTRAWRAQNGHPPACRTVLGLWNAGYGAKDRRGAHAPDARGRLGRRGGDGAVWGAGGGG